MVDDNCLATECKVHSSSYCLIVTVALLKSHNSLPFLVGLYHSSSAHLFYFHVFYEIMLKKCIPPIPILKREQDIKFPKMFHTQFGSWLGDCGVEVWRKSRVELYDLVKTEPKISTCGEIVCYFWF